MLIEQKNMELVSAFYNTAKSDLRVSILLYRNCEYPSAIFYLQQAVEKISKAYGLENKIIKPTQKSLSQDISHNSKRVFTKQIARQQEEINKLEKVEEIFPDLLAIKINDETIDLTGHNKKFRKASQAVLHLKPEDFMWLDCEEIDDVLSHINELDIDVDLNLSDIKRDFPILFENIISHFEKKTGKKLEELRQAINEESFVEDMFPLIKDMISMGLKIIKIYLTLFFLSLITTGHNQHSRYPCLCCAEIPEDDYHENEPLIIKFLDIHRVLSESFQYFEDVFLKK